MSNLFVDFCDFDEVDVEMEKEIKEAKNYEKKFNSQTEVFYKKMRELEYNVFTHDKFEYSSEKKFKFQYKWDPYTGERMGIDIFGPLCFDPDDLIYFYYKRRLNMLWNEPIYYDNILYSSYYGDALGSGRDIFIKGRGIHPELYLFRLPVDDCYLEENYDMSIITLGPIITDEEICQIDYLASKYHGNNYEKKYNKKRPLLSKIKELYDLAIDENIGYIKNREAVDDLISQ